MTVRLSAPYKSTIGRTALFSLYRHACSGLSHLAPWLAVPVAERIFMKPPQAQPPQRELAWAEGAEQSTIPTSRGPLAAWSWGDGDETVLLIHGWGGRGLQLGGFAAPLVQQGFRVVTYDAPGHGASPGQTSSMPEMARALTEVVRAVGPVSGIVAHSLGASAALLVVSRLKVKRIVTLAPATSMANILERFGVLTGFSTPVLERLQTRVEERLQLNWQEIEPLQFAAGIKARLLVVHDCDDREVPWSEGVDLAEACPQAELMLTHGLGHRRLLRDEAVISRTTEALAGRGAANLRTLRNEVGSEVAVPLPLQILGRDETQGSRVDAVAQSGGWRPVGEQVAEM